jgi:hypothetical protein
MHREVHSGGVGNLHVLGAMVSAGLGYNVNWEYIISHLVD